MPASKKRALLNGKAGKGKSASKAGRTIDQFFSEVSKKLEKGPLPKDNESQSQVRASRKRVSGRKKAKKVTPRANTMKTNQGAGARANTGKTAKSASPKGRKKAGSRA